MVNKKLKYIQKSLFFKSLTKNSQEDLLQAWPHFSHEQVTRILLLIGYEKVLLNFIANQVVPITAMAQRKILEKLKKKAESVEQKTKEDRLDDLINNI